MNSTQKFMITLIMITFAIFATGGAYASTITVSDGQVSQAGGTTTVPITLDVADTGLISYRMTITVGDPSIAQVTKVDFPPWVNIQNIETTLPATSVVTSAGDLQLNVNAFHNQPGATNIPIATLTMNGLKAGFTPVSVQFVGLGVSGGDIYPTIKAGTLQVNGVAPTQITTAVTTQATTVVTTQATTAVTTQVTTAVTTQATTVVPITTTTVVPTTPTPVPTMPVPTGPTGQVYFSTTPQGAAIFIDGARTNAVTPFIIAVPVGTHQVVFKLAGYNDLQAGFTAQQSSMATVSRRLSPGASVIPTTPVTTVATTVPRTTGTQITTVPTTVPTVVPTTVPTTVPGYWSYQAFIPSWLKNYLPFF